MYFYYVYTVYSLFRTCCPMIQPKGLITHISPTGAVGTHISRAPDGLRRYSARPRTTIYGFPRTIYGFSTTIYRFSTIIYEFSMFKNTRFEPKNEPQRSKIGFDHL